MRPLIPPPPGTKKAAEMQAAAFDLFDAFLVIQNLMSMGGVRCVTLAAGGIVNVVTSDDHPAEERKAPEKTREQVACDVVELEMAEHRSTNDIACGVVAALAAWDAANAPAAPAKPVIKRFLGVNLFEGFLAAAAGGYAQVERMANQSENKEVKADAQRFIDHVKQLREVRTKRIIAP